jgi:hypothetical protein
VLVYRSNNQLKEIFHALHHNNSDATQALQGFGGIRVGSEGSSQLKLTSSRIKRYADIIENKPQISIPVHPH